MFVSVLTASDVDLSKIVQVVTLCRVEPNSALGTIDKGLGPRVQKHGLECRHLMRAG